jgi:hypothetical protein
MKHVLGVLALVVLLAGGTGLAVLAQDEPEFEEEPPAEEPRAGGTLKPRPKDDPRSAEWRRRLTLPGARALSAKPGLIPRLCVAPDGSRAFFIRAVGTKDAPAFELWAAGPGRPEALVAALGLESQLPHFLPDGRLLVTSRRFDSNDDGITDHRDLATLALCNPDGSGLEEVALLAPLETAVAVWREGREALLAVPGREGVNGEIVSLNLETGKRQAVCPGFNIELVLADGRLVVERLARAASAEDATSPGLRRLWRIQPGAEEPPEPEPEAPAGLLDASEHMLFDPRDGTTIELYSARSRSRLVAHAENSFFGIQEEDRHPFQHRVLIVDDEKHRDTRYLVARNEYQPLAWHAEGGLLVLETMRLKRRVLVLDRALAFWPVAELSFTTALHAASPDGRRLAFLDLEDTTADGALEPWADHGRLHWLELR